MSILYVFAIVFFEATAWARGTPNTMALVDEGTFGLFEDANRIYVDYQKQIFVADAHTNQVSMFTQPQESPKVIGGYGWSQTSFDTPTGIVADGVNVYISDKGNRRIQRYDRSLNFISSWSLVGNPDNAKNCGYPLGIVLTSSGEFFVLIVHSGISKRQKESFRILSRVRFQSLSKSMSWNPSEFWCMMYTVILYRKSEKAYSTKHAASVSQKKRSGSFHRMKYIVFLLKAVSPARCRQQISYRKRRFRTCATSVSMEIGCTC